MAIRFSSKRIVLGFFHKLGYVLFQKKAFAQKVTETETPSIKQEWLDDVKVISDRYSVLSLLPACDKVAEVGVGYGDFSKELIKALKPSEFIAIDTFDGNANDKWGAPLLQHSMTHLEYYLHNLGDVKDQINVITKQGLSWVKVAELQEDYFDFMYIDADHSYKSVKKDIVAASNKIKIGGYMQCNDFTHFDTHNYVHYGVPRAVFELLETETYKMCYLCLATNGFYDVVLQRIK